MFQKILVPVDFTAKNRQALKIAQDLAKHHQGQIILLHVIERIEHLNQSELRVFYRSLQKKAATRLKSLEKEIRKRGLKVNVRTELGNRTEKIIRYAAEKKVDLILLNSHKVSLKKKGSDWGTISYKVAILAPCPVLLVK